MGMTIKDGRGNGREAGVNTNYQLEAFAEMVSVSAFASLSGATFLLPTSFIALTTTATEHGIIYLKNRESVNIRIGSILVSSDQSTQWKLVRNPTLGTLITGGTDIVPANAHFENDTEMTGDEKPKAGANGSTVTDGTLAGCALVNGVQDLALEGAIILGPNKALALTAEIGATTNVAVTMVVSATTV